jgi:hypothetical protein
MVIIDISLIRLLSYVSFFQVVKVKYNSIKHIVTFSYYKKIILDLVILKNSKLTTLIFNIVKEHFSV